MGALNDRKGDLRIVADGSGIAYDTVLRVKNREGDPGYSKIRTLAKYLFPADAPMPARSKSHQPGQRA